MPKAGDVYNINGNEEWSWREGRAKVTTGWEVRGTATFDGIAITIVLNYSVPEKPGTVRTITLRKPFYDYNPKQQERGMNFRWTASDEKGTCKLIRTKSGDNYTISYQLKGIISADNRKYKVSGSGTGTNAAPIILNE